MTVFSNAQYRLSAKGGSAEVILFCHGGWTTDDGKVIVPEGMVVHFYSAHGQFGTKGVPIASSLLGVPYADDTPLPFSIYDALLKRQKAENWSDERLDEEALQAKARANSQGKGESMEIYESVTGGRTGPRGLSGKRKRQKVYNYNLAYNGPSTSEMRMESLFLNHEASTKNIDLMIMQKNAVGHLVDALSFALTAGEDYTVFHFLPCRFVEAADKKAMKTVGNLMAGLEGVKFIETSLL